MSNFRQESGTKKEKTGPVTGIIVGQALVLSKKTITGPVISISVPLSCLKLVTQESLSRFRAKTLSLSLFFRQVVEFFDQNEPFISF